MSDSILLQICPSCKRKSLMFNEVRNKYECLNCRDSFFKVTIDKYNQQISNETSESGNSNAIAWSGNQYYDPIKKKWAQGKKPNRVRIYKYGWIWTILGFIFISLVITLVLNFLFPGTKFFIWGW
jgi:hypothetical protein